jgi:signal transduction histidine kinase
VAVRIGVIIAMATVVSYWQVRSNLERQALDSLETYVEQRRARESNIFLLASDHIAMFREAYRARLAEPDPRAPSPTAAFSWLFETRPDGTTRIKEQHFARSGITGFVGRHVAIDDDLRHRLVIAYDLLAQFGPAWRNRFVNLYVVTPENAVLMYWPDQSWAQASSEWEIYGKLALIAGADGDEVVVSGMEVEPALAALRWSELYFDYAVRDWMVSATGVVTWRDRTMLAVGHDVLLRDLIDRALTSELRGTYNLIFRADGRLIAHPRLMEAILAGSGRLGIKDTGDAHLMRIFSTAMALPADRIIVENPADREFLAVTRLRGPEWYLVTVFPEAIVAERAFATARLILALGALALVLEVIILYLVLRRQVARPLHDLIDATRQVADGHFDAVVTAQRDDEIGQLARSFNDMAREIRAREAALQERSIRLFDLSERLKQELAERHRVEAEMARQRDALHQSEKLNALGSMLAGIAHELNNPLTVVVGRAVLLEEQLRHSPHGDRIGKLRAAAERCVRIVKTFLAMARQQPPTREPVEINDVIDQSLELVTSSLRGAGIEVIRTRAPGLPTISANPAQLVQVLTNLLINALHALADQPGSRRIHVGTDLGADGQGLIVTVADNGPGIPAELRSRIFEPFFTTKPVGKGTGMGLSLCYGIVHAHGGTIAVRSGEGAGTTFTIALPAVAQAPAARSGGAAR